MGQKAITKQIDIAWLETKNLMFSQMPWQLVNIPTNKVQPNGDQKDGEISNVTKFNSEITEKILKAIGFNILTKL